jgi:hypothetical protein
MFSDRLYHDIQINKENFLEIKKGLERLMMTDTYVSISDVISVKNFINQLYPGFDMDKINEISMQEMKILCYRILLTR